jgi:hypothetical protein
MPFRPGLIEFGATPLLRGIAPKSLGCHFRWGGAATAHRTASPRTSGVTGPDGFADDDSPTD